MQTACIIRPYSRHDRLGVRHVCCETGFMGNPIQSVFNDRDAFADFFTRYYTDWEPESCLVAEAGGQIVGYLLGCLNYRKYAIVQPLIIAGITAPKVAFRAISGKYEKQSIRFLKWFLFRSYIETPKRPAKSAHFHVNFLPEWRTAEPARRIIFSFLDTLKERGARKVYGQIQTFQNRRSDKLFERFGFKLYDRKQITKFKDKTAEKIYVSTYFCYT